MKTPKRYQNKPLPMLPEDNVVDDWVIEIWCARAKRKNRIAQLKRTIARLEAENARLWDGFSRMSKRCAELYDTFIFDKHP